MKTSFQYHISGLLRGISLTLIILLISCTTPPRLTYEGERNQEEKYHGKGVITYSNEEKWEGEFKDGLPFNGNGVYYYPNGSKFVGEWKDGLLNGQGTYISPDGFSYEGDFKGKNISEITHFLISPSETRYDGVITRGTRKVGFGIFTANSHSYYRLSPTDSLDRFGNRYEGEFKDNTFDGQGTFTFSDGQKYIGEWKDGKNDGQGTLTFPDGREYVGEWKDSEYDGQGTYTFPDGREYVGEWKDGLRNGQGTYTFLGGKKYVGEFKDDLPNGQGTYTLPNGEKYVGEYKDGKKNGQGTFTFSNGAKYVGEYKDGKKNGQGTYTFPNGEKYVGEFKDGLRNGKGVLFKVNGEIQSGTWEKDRFGNVWTIEAVDNFLKNKYPQFKGLNYSTPTTSVSSQRNDVYLPPPPDNPSFIAVVDFTGNNVNEGDCRALTDRLRIELYNTKYYKVIERAMMDDILEEQKFQTSGCVSDECIVEIGKMIGVEQIVGGSISQVGNIFSVSARIVNVETGEIENTAVFDHTGNIGQLLTEGMRIVAVDLIK
jgi:TolB-like protein